jgi:RNA polymerase sigma-70 factor (ECF subfamily)
MKDREQAGNSEQDNYGEFEQFFRTNQPRMVLYANRFVDDWETARDIVQEVFLSYWENKHRIELTGSLQSYLFTAVKNQCANYIKHKIVVQKYTDTTQAEFRQLEINYYATTEEQHLKLFEQELGEKIGRSVRTLPEQCRRTFELSRFEGMKSGEIAKEMNISVRTVETQLYRALKVLKELLKDYLPLF